ncbi:hypothetical protein, partial [Bacillus sp. SIMBA_074]|uniref:hypothetical protein n=1 Tax=Bacillus sp. SIMBA_074 TaxID=3085812 RepID=UPI003978D3CD
MPHTRALEFDEEYTRQSCAIAESAGERNSWTSSSKHLKGMGITAWAIASLSLSACCAT